MNRPIFHPLALIGLSTVGSGANAPRDGSGAAAWMPSLHTVPNRAECGAAAPRDRTSCYQILLENVLKAEGMDSAMSALTALASSEAVVRGNSHMLAHSLGLAAFTTPAELASVFTKCSPGFQSGCYHGVIQGYFLDLHHKSPGKAIGAQEINSLCRDFRSREQTWLLFQCAHGLGHGLELIYAHDLPRSLTGCDLVSDSWERIACYGGAFMENIVSVTNPHQTAEAIAGGMEMEGMSDDMAGMEMGDSGHPDSAHRFRQLDPANPLYPCSALPTRYGSQHPRL